MSGYVWICQNMRDYTYICLNGFCFTFLHFTICFTIHFLLEYVVIRWVGDSKMQSATCVSVKCQPKNFRFASCDFGNLRVVSYNSTSLWVASCELIIVLWVGSCISVHYIRSALSVYIISSLHVKQSKSNMVIWYIPIMIYTWEQL